MEVMEQDVFASKGKANAGEKVSPVNKLLELLETPNKGQSAAKQFYKKVCTNKSKCKLPTIYMV